MLSILQHALGVDKHGQGRQYRDHFVAGPGHSDYETCLAAERAGLMSHCLNIHVFGEHIFYVTDAGRDYVAAHSLPPPKLTRGQRRYRAFLDHDNGERFGDWLKSYGRKIA